MLSARGFSTVVAALVACALAAPAAQASWTVAAGTVPSNVSQFSGVACVTSTNCLLVGTQSGGSSTALARSWNGTTLGTLTPSTTTAELYGAGCNSATLCFAVGTNYASGAVPHAERYNGSTWVASAPPNPAGSTFSQLETAACPGSTSCFAVGHYTAGGVDQALIERWNGTSWSIQTPTLPAGATTANLSDVSCTSTSACTAVGTYATSSGVQTSLALRWNGTAWSSQTVPTPAGATAAQLEGVSCTSSTACHAVGFYVDAASAQQSLAAVWNGTTWTLKAVPVPAGASDAALSDISCYTSPSAGCVAVGGYTASGGTIVPLAAGYNGTSWALQSVTLPAGTSDGSLADVSCTSGTTCLAAGIVDYNGTTGITGIRPVAYKGP